MRPVKSAISRFLAGFKAFFRSLPAAYACQGSDQPPGA
jgi:hypothetical protein